MSDLKEDPEELMEDVSIFIGGCSQSGKTTVAIEICRILRNQGFNVKAKEPDGSPVMMEGSDIHVKKRRALMEIGCKVNVHVANFPEERFHEILEREAAVEKPLIVYRIHWGYDITTDKIFPGNQYLVQLRERWYTGTFRIREDHRCWQFIDIDENKLYNFEGHKRIDLGVECSKSSSIKSIYEIAEAGSRSYVLTQPD